MSSPQLKSLRPALFIAPGLVVEVTEIVAHKADEPNDAKFLGVDFDALGERAQVIAAVAAALGPHLLASAAGATTLGRYFRASIANAYAGLQYCCQMSSMNLSCSR